MFLSVGFQPALIILRNLIYNTLEFNVGDRDILGFFYV